MEFSALTLTILAIISGILVIGALVVGIYALVDTLNHTDPVIVIPTATVIPDALNLPKSVTFSHDFATSTTQNIIDYGGSYETTAVPGSSRLTFVIPEGFRMVPTSIVVQYTAVDVSLVTACSIDLKRGGGGSTGQKPMDKPDAFPSFVLPVNLIDQDFFDMIDDRAGLYLGIEFDTDVRFVNTIINYKLEEASAQVLQTREEYNQIHGIVL